MESHFVAQVIPEAHLASTPTEKASHQFPAQSLLEQAHLGLPLPRTSHRQWSLSA